MAEPGPKPIGTKLPPSESWKCYRCGTVLPSPGDGRPPVACLESLGGCGRDVETTIFFPASWGEAKCDLYARADMDEGQRLFYDVLDTLSLHYYMDQPWHYVIASLFVLQARVTDVLPIVFYLFVGGTKGTGKTNFLSLMASLTGALQFENVSIPAMARTMKHGRTVTMDELDAGRNKEYVEVRDALIRSGYKANAPPYTRWDASKRSVEEVPVYGPRVLGYRGILDDALQSRGYVIPSVTPKGEAGYDYVLKNFWPEIGDLPARLETWGKEAVSAFPPGRLKEIAYSAPFREKVKTVAQEIGANRESELATVALLVAEAAGVDILGELRSANALREIETAAASDSDLEELADVVLEMSGIAQEKITEGAPAIRLRQPEIKKELNRRRKERGDRPIADRHFAKLRRDLGIKDDWLATQSGHSLAWNLPPAWLRTLGQMGQMGQISPYGENLPNLPNLPMDAGHVYDEDTGPINPDPRKQRHLDQIKHDLEPEGDP